MVTANSLIGSYLYDSEGEAVGEITDISLASTKLGQMKPDSARGSQSSRQGKNEQSKSDRSRSGSSSSSNQGSSSASSQQASNSSGSGNSTGNSQSDSKSSKSDSDSQRSSSQMSGASDELSLIVAVQDGFKEGFVSIPASSVSYNSSESRYEISETKDQVASIAKSNESGPDAIVLVDPTPPPAVAVIKPIDDSSNKNQDQSSQNAASQSSQSGTKDNNSESSKSGNSSAASQDFGKDATDVRTAIITDDKLGVESTGISVSKQENKIVLKGTVSSKEMKKQAEKVAKEATSLDIKNEIEVEK